MSCVKPAEVPATRMHGLHAPALSDNAPARRTTERITDGALGAQHELEELHCLCGSVMSCGICPRTGRRPASGSPPVGVLLPITFTAAAGRSFRRISSDGSNYSPRWVVAGIVYAAVALVSALAALRAIPGKGSSAPCHSEWQPCWVEGCPSCSPGPAGSRRGRRSETGRAQNRRAVTLTHVRCPDRLPEGTIRRGLRLGR
jgi:hypothetical protein